MELGPPLHVGVVLIENEAFGSPSSKVTDFTTFIIIVLLASFSHQLQLMIFHWSLIDQPAY